MSHLKIIRSSQSSSCCGQSSGFLFSSLNLFWRYMTFRYKNLNISTVWWDKVIRWHLRTNPRSREHWLGHRIFWFPRWKLHQRRMLALSRWLHSGRRRTSGNPLLSEKKVWHVELPTKQVDDYLDERSEGVQWLDRSDRFCSGWRYTKSHPWAFFVVPDSSGGWRYQAKRKFRCSRQSATHPCISSRYIHHQRSWRKHRKSSRPDGRKFHSYAGSNRSYPEAPLKSSNVKCFVAKCRQSLRNSSRSPQSTLNCWSHLPTRLMVSSNTKPSGHNRSFGTPSLHT